MTTGKLRDATSGLDLWIAGRESAENLPKAITLAWLDRALFLVGRCAGGYTTLVVQAPIVLGRVTPSLPRLKFDAGDGWHGMPPLQPHPRPGPHCPNPDIGWAACRRQKGQAGDGNSAKSFRFMQIGASLDKDDHRENLESQLPKGEWSGLTHDFKKGR
jgi:hypothetical protein